jgi:hypothetical protein
MWRESGETVMEGTIRQTLFQAFAQHQESPVLCVAHPSGTYIDVYMPRGYGYLYPAQSGKSILIKSLPVLVSVLDHKGLNDQQWYIVPPPYLRSASVIEAVQRG